MNSKIATLIAAGSGLAASLYSSFFLVDVGENAVLVRLVDGSVKSQVYSEGIHMKNPWDRAVIYNVRPQPHLTKQILTYTREYQQAEMYVRVVSHPLAHHLPAIYRNYGDDYFELVLNDKIDQILGGETVKYTTKEFALHREEITRLMKKKLTPKFAEYDIALDDIFITSLRIGGRQILGRPPSEELKMNYCLRCWRQIKDD